MFHGSFGRPIPFRNGSWGSDSMLWDISGGSRCLQVADYHLCVWVMCLNSGYQESVAQKESDFKLFFLDSTAWSRRVSYVSCLAAPLDTSWIPLNISNGTKCQCLCNWIPPAASTVSGACRTVFFTSTWIYASWWAKLLSSLNYLFWLCVWWELKHWTCPLKCGQLNVDNLSVELNSTSRLYSSGVLMREKE